ncbi:MAG: hypothetical protein A2539_09945 [Elusimicrobia bacterium RIFOXYD2_FULL_34_15]|nr:MAG: hypothetical protein A2539_09945 [Elusimicrobia bacterium RIFOXYD2_FULL_34_15]
MLKYRRLLIIVLHFIFIVLSYITAFYIRFDFTFPKEYLQVVERTIPLLILIKLLFFYSFGLFVGLWRYVSIGDIWKILLANMLSSVTFFGGVVFYRGLVGYPRSVFILDFILCVAIVSGVRFLTRLIREKSKIDLSEKRKKVLIVGAGDAGVLTLKECQNNINMDVEVVGFIDDDPIKKGHNIYGVKVFGGRKLIPDIVDGYGVEEIILAIPSASGDVIREILYYCELTDARIKTIPGLDKILEGNLEVKPRAVKPEDLLGRKSVKIDKKEISSCIMGRTILVTGAGGSIGSELCRQIASFSPENIILVDNHENYVYFLGIEFKSKYPQLKFDTIIGDIKDIGFLRYVFSTYKPQVIFHAAAHKHVPLMEENPSAAVKNNVVGTRNIIYASSHYKAERFILISTDKAVNASSVMGATKRIAEKILQAKSKNSKTKFMAVRFGNVLGSSGSVIPLFKKQIEEGGPVTVTHPDVKRYFMSISEASQLVLQAGAIGTGGEIFVLDMGEQIKIVDIAKNLIAFSGLKLGRDISIEYVGLRPGEKLFEEILLNTEEDKVTKNDKIYITKPGDFDSAKIRKQIRELEKYANNFDDDKITDMIKRMVPSYKPESKSKD